MSVLDLLLPSACAACGRAGVIVCVACAASFEPASSVGDRFVIADAGIVLGDPLALGIGVFAYRGAVRRTLAALKYTGARRAAAPLATACAPTLGRLLEVSGPAVLVPVPLHADRRRERGYNQAELLADGLARRVGRPVLQVLRRGRSTVKQHRLGRAARVRNLRDAFEASAPAPSVAIIVDDIITTSATLEVCAGVLRAAGASLVYGFAVAREV